MTKRRKKEIWRRKSSELTPRWRSLRRLSLEVLRRVRRGASLSGASRAVGVSSATVKRHSGKALVKRRGAWTHRGWDRIARVMRIYENGSEQIVEVPDLSTASNIGRYHSIVGKYLDSGDESILREAQTYRLIRDVNGRTHELELRPDVLYRIATKRAEPEFFQIYHE